MNMENMDTILNELVAKLLTEGSASFSQDGLNIKTSYDNGCLAISATYESPKVDDGSEKLISAFEDYVQSLNDEFFLEITESFKDGELKAIQEKLDTKNTSSVKEGIAEFMSHLKAVAAGKINEISKDIEAAEKDLSDLIEVRDSYIHALNKKF